MICECPICGRNVKTKYKLDFEDLLGSGVKLYTQHIGHCQNCDQDVDFIVDDNYAVDVAGKKYVNYRERLVCPQCQLNNRMRALIGLLGEYVDIKNDKVANAHNQAIRELNSKIYNGR